LFFILARKYADQAFLLDELSPRSPGGLRMVFLQWIREGTVNKDSDADEMVLYIVYRGRRVYVGDMYVLLSELELTLHRKIQSILQKKFGAADAEWWGQGIPLKVRTACNSKREEDAQYLVHAYSYTSLIDLRTILEENKKLFGERLPAALANLKVFSENLFRLNKIRNQVMHPVREHPPTENEFVFVKNMHRILCGKGLWR
jgi:hypothetical protein